MTQLYKYYIGDESGEETELLGVVSDSTNQGFGNIDVATVNLLIDTGRTGVANALKGQMFIKERQNDSFIEFRGLITEVREVENDRYNLTLKIRAKSKVITELTLDALEPKNHETNAKVMGPNTISAVTAGKISDSSDDYEDFSNGYVASDHAVLIVPGEESARVRSLAESWSAIGGAGTSGAFGDVNDDDPSSGIKATLNNEKDIWVQIDGSSVTAKASVVGAKVKIVCKATIPGASNSSVYLQYYDNDLVSWVNFADNPLSLKYEIIQFFHTWTGELSLNGGIETNEFLDGADDWQIRVRVTNANNNAEFRLKIHSLDLTIYSDAKYKGAHFPISSYSGDDTGMNVSVNPVTAGVDVGDTYVVGLKNIDALESCFAQFTLIERKGITIDVDSNFVGYTSRDFDNVTLFDILNYFAEKETARWWYDHDADIIRIYKESGLASGATLREPSNTDIETYGFDDKTDSNVKDVAVSGATFKRGDGDEVVVRYNYPDKFDDTIYTKSIKTLYKDKPEIFSTTEAREYAKGLYFRLNIETVSYNLVPYVFQVWELRDRLTLTIDGHSISNENITGVTNNYNVGNNHVTQSFRIGFQQTKLIKRQSDKIAELQQQVNDLFRAFRGVKVNSEHTLLRADLDNIDGIIPSGSVSEASIRQYEEHFEVPGSLLTNAVTVANIPSLNASKVTAGTFSDLRISSSSVVQHQTDITAVGKLDALEVTGNIETDADIICLTGKFASATVEIGDTVIGEDGEMTVSDPLTPGISLIDTGDAGDDARGYYRIVDKNGQVIGEIGMGGGNDILHISRPGGSIQLDVATKFATSLVGVAGAVITAFDTDPLAASDTKVPTNTTVKEYVDKHNMIGSANKKFVQMIPLPVWLSTGGGMTGNYIYKTGSKASAWMIKLPISEGGLSLQITQSTSYFSASDGANFITRFRIIAQKSDGTTVTLVDDGANKSGVGLHTWNYADKDLSGYSWVVFYLNSTTATDALLQVETFETECYYA